VPVVRVEVDEQVVIDAAAKAVDQAIKPFGDSISRLEKMFVNSAPALEPVPSPSSILLRRLTDEQNEKSEMRRQRDQALHAHSTVLVQKNKLFSYIKSRKPCEFCTHELDECDTTCKGCVNRSKWEPWLDFPVAIGEGGVFAKSWRSANSV
jgi:hypothetical protein